MTKKGKHGMGDILQGVDKEVDSFEIMPSKKTPKVKGKMFSGY